MSRLACLLAFVTACGVVQDLGPTLAVTKTGDGTVSSTPAGIDCGTTCSHPFSAGTAVTLSAMPNAGSVFIGWTGASCSGTDTCVVDLATDTNVQAMFGGGVELDVVLAGDGTGTVTSSPAGIDCGSTCSAMFAPGASVTLTAVPAGTNSFSGWSGGGCTGTLPCTTTIDAMTSITATFSKHGSQMFTSPGTFTVPPGVTSIRVLAVGGGGGGTNGHQGGGGSGLVATGTFAVTAGTMIAVTVGAFGTGAAAQDGNNNIVGNTPGGTSTFGAMLSAAGGQTSTVVNGPGGNGGSGGGGSCNAGTTGGAGGTGGTNGGSCSYAGGTGQGSFVAAIAIFTVHAMTAASGGAGGTSSHAGGGGGGGVFVDGTGPTASDGGAAFSGKGGAGYGAGGGAGGYDQSGTIRYAGGDGTQGIVYVEW